MIQTKLRMRRHELARALEALLQLILHADPDDQTVLSTMFERYNINYIVTCREIMSAEGTLPADFDKQINWRELATPKHRTR